MGVSSVPPHSIEAEESCLGAMLRSVGAVDEVFSVVTAEDFYVPAYRLIAAAVKRLYDDGQPIDTITVLDRLQRDGTQAKAGGPATVAGLWDKVPSAANASYYASVVAEHSHRRQILDAASKIIEIASDLDREPESVADDCEQTLLGVSEQRSGGMTHLGGMLPDVIEQIEAAENNPDLQLGVTTGLVDLDAKLGGMHAGQLLVLAGRPGMGKSALALNIAGHVAQRYGPVAYFTLEMSASEVAQRWLAAAAKVDLMAIRGGQLDQAGWRQLIAAAGTLYKTPLYIDDRVRTVTDMRAQSRRMARDELHLVVVDYMQLMSSRSRRRGWENRQQEIADISLNLKALARELEVPLIAVSQLNRALENRGDRRPRLGDLRESGAIEQDADVVVMIYRDAYYKESNDRAAELNVAKQRSGPTGTVNVTFIQEQTRFGNATRVTEPAY